MSTVLIASGTTATTSSDFTLAAGESTTLFLIDAAGTDVAFASQALIQIKETNSGAYFTIGRLDSNTPGQVLSAPGTFRVSRAASDVAFGVARG